MGLIAWIIVGLLAGWLTGMLTASASMAETNGSATLDVY